MDNQALQQIKDIIEHNDQIGIAVGRNPQIDDMAAALALYLTFKAAGKKVAIASATEPLVEHSSLVGIDKVDSKLQGGQNSGGDLTVAFPYKDEGEIEKVSYTIDNGYLNIIVKAGEQGLSFSEEDVKYSHSSVNLSGLLIAVGTPKLADLGGLYNEENAKDLTVINIDNKEQNENYGNVVLVSPRFSSVSEQVADLLLSLGYDFDIDIAQNLINGISAATNNFQNQNTSYLAFEIAAILLRKGAKRPSRINQPNHQINQQPQRKQPDMQQRDNQPRPQQQARTQNQNRFGDRQQQQGQQNRQQNQNGRQVQPQQPSNLEQTRQQLSQLQNQQQPKQQQSNQQADDTNPPADWLTPKVYKGSSNIE
ncbi:MAG TPA: hypothetical protein VMR41_01695 [Patescibacteria group bacterium]|nr:hypothetical protein [Patescibacteria group bacterium]